MKKTPTEFKCDVLKVVNDDSGDRGGSEIRIVRWIINNGAPSQPMLEKRAYRMQGEVKYFGKSKGFTKRDLNIIVERWEEIAGLMENGN